MIRESCRAWLAPNRSQPAIPASACSLRAIVLNQLHRAHPLTAPPRALQSNGLTANELLGATAPAQAASLLLMGPPMDKLVTNSWIFNYVWSQPAVVFLVLSCLLAVGVNITQFMVLGRFTASSYQVGRSLVQA
jgi:hypothetical protein